MESNISIYDELLPYIYERVISEEESITGISKRYLLNRNRISKLLKERYGYISPSAKYSKLANKKDFEKIDKEAFVRYQNGESLTSISNDYGIKRHSLSKRLKAKFGIEIVQNNKLPINEEYFSAHTVEMYYWLGFIFGDGCISNGSFEVTSKDLCIIEKFKESVNGEQKITTKTIKGIDYYRFSTKNKIFIRNLKDLGIEERKSFIKTTIPEVPNEFFNDFLRGLIDADGHIYFKKDKKNRLRRGVEISIGHANEKLAIELSNKINSIANVNSIIYKGNTCFSLRICRVNDVNTILKYIYKDAIVYMERKYAVAKQILPS